MIINSTVGIADVAHSGEYCYIHLLHICDTNAVTRLRLVVQISTLDVVANATS